MYGYVSIFSKVKYLFTTKSYYYIINETKVHPIPSTIYTTHSGIGPVTFTKCKCLWG